MPTIEGSYDGPTARICAELSFNTYKYPSDIRQRIADLIPNAAVRVHNGLPGDTQVVVVSTTEAVFVVFRGTVLRSARSIVVNLRARRIRWGNGLVHRGFLRIIAGASPLILQDLRDYQSSTKRLCFTGHSQGGAAAYLAGVTFALRSGQTPSAVYTFGQPRAGDAQFSRDAEARLQRTLSRITNGRDFVVGVPFVWNGYDHTREYLHYGQNWLITRRSQFAGQGWPSRSLADHSMLQYLRRSHFNESLELV